MTNRSTLRKRKSRENETIEYREINRAKDRENKQMKSHQKLQNSAERGVF